MSEAGRRAAVHRARASVAQWPRPLPCPGRIPGAGGRGGEPSVRARAGSKSSSETWKVRVGRRGSRGAGVEGGGRLGEEGLPTPHRPADWAGRGDVGRRLGCALVVAAAATATAALEEVAAAVEQQQRWAQPPKQQQQQQQRRRAQPPELEGPRRPLRSAGQRSASRPCGARCLSRLGPGGACGRAKRPQGREVGLEDMVLDIMSV
ncbi:uncharacterized protein LOC110218666 [Phascolarctos cinereus]|uniref:Uncharacterized protein LOC110218666 n=1 Tax=Phascolarctos cinereus TaxID=38626 RepID=A0A6P5LH31_PHACI|nr:uncharacterized protein LOC110218666 [Phascolarctos cinereus]